MTDRFKAEDADLMRFLYTIFACLCAEILFCALSAIIGMAIIGSGIGEWGRSMVTLLFIVLVWFFLAMNGAALIGTVVFVFLKRVTGRYALYAVPVYLAQGGALYALSFHQTMTMYVIEAVVSVVLVSLFLLQLRTLRSLPLSSGGPPS